MSNAVSILFGNFGRASLFQFDQSLAMHAHREKQLSFLVEGPPLLLRAGDESCPVNHDVAGVIKPFVPHSLDTPALQSPPLSLTLYIDPDWLARTHPNSKVPELESSRCSFAVSADSKKLIQQIVAGMTERRHDESLRVAIELLIANCFCELTCAEPTAFRSPHQTVCSIDRRVESAREFMLNSVRTGASPTMEQIAGRVGLSRTLLFKLFREQLGASPKVYLDTLRLDHSIEKLAFTRDSVTSIALDTGFASQPGFTRFFSATVGVPPSNFRQVAQGMD